MSTVYLISVFYSDGTKQCFNDVQGYNKSGNILELTCLFNDPGTVFINLLETIVVYIKVK